MRLCYVLLSPTWGMHQYTADLANRVAVGDLHASSEPAEVHLVTTSHAPRDRYAPQVRTHTPADTADSGFSVAAAVGVPFSIGRLSSAMRRLDPDLVHFTGPHLWNPLLLDSLCRAGVPTVHTLHDLHPHAGARYGRLLYGWNAWVQRRADHLLVHGRCYRDELLAAGRAPSDVTCTPLTHLFVGHAKQQALAQSPPEVCYEPWALLIGRLETYKGVHVLVEAACRLDLPGAGVVIAGPGRLEGLIPGALPANVEVRNQLIDDDEAVELFRRCGLLVLPYIEASQSALVAAAYYFRKPVIVTKVGALPEYVVEGKTGWVIPPADPDALAGALNRALSDPARLELMGCEGRAWYDHQRHAEGAILVELYQRLAGRS